MNKKIFCYVGSPRGEKSITINLARKLLTYLSHRSECIYKIYSPSELKLEKCLGCECCFKNGNCELDKVDNFDKIKNEMISSDVIILGTPVYAGTISSYLKEFIERLSLWLHIFKLAGKCGVIIATSTGNSLNETAYYLRRIMHGWGISDIYTMLIPVQTNDDLEKAEINEEINRCVEYLCSFLSGLKKPASNNYLEQYFQTLKKLYLPVRNFEHYEAKYWNENGFFELNSYKELLEILYKGK
ncbi:NADPH-dependent FMN reductase [Caldicellulosiruptor acetigenus I77R1B]|uniref:NADPH-dependent FMN reductase n=2 Tax=Caldicellulosiruptor TaxID=44000 RepID=E4S815_CALA7|nr:MULTISPECIES: flavodoxin family protein [Caldicellulosiruptor]ADQ39863.1 NADPH-dependent FMN reductase [Caldicellulosiruptor acetigenus I77R1B]WAM34917.1 flavodoxin family protein [Caldicellulosiruptor morganii]